MFFWFPYNDTVYILYISVVCFTTTNIKDFAPRNQQWTGSSSVLQSAHAHTHTHFNI